MLSKSIINGVKSAAMKIAQSSTSAGRVAKSNTFVREVGKGFANASGMILAVGTATAVTDYAQKRRAQQAYDRKTSLGRLFSSRPE